MRRMRAAWILGFGLMAMAGIGYAHSQTTIDAGEVVYQSHSRLARLLLGSCELRVRQEKSTYLFAPATFTRTEFKGFWALHAGTIEMAARIHQDASDGEPPSDMNEVLSVTFASVGGTLQPVSYVYGNDSGENHYLTSNECKSLGL